MGEHGEDGGKHYTCWTSPCQPCHYEFSVQQRVPPHRPANMALVHGSVQPVSNCMQTQPCFLIQSADSCSSVSLCSAGTDSISSTVTFSGPSESSSASSFNRFTDSPAVEEALREGCLACVRHILSSIRSELAAASPDPSPTRLSSVLFMARLCQSMGELCPNLKHCILGKQSISEAKIKGTPRQGKKLGKARAATEVSPAQTKWVGLREELLTCSMQRCHHRHVASIYLFIRLFINNIMASVKLSFNLLPLPPSYPDVVQPYTRFSPSLFKSKEEEQRVAAASKMSTCGNIVHHKVSAVKRWFFLRN